MSLPLEPSPDKFMGTTSNQLHESSRALKFLVVGPINALVSFLAFAIASEIFNRALPSIVIATVAGWTFSYQMNKRLVWNNFSRGSFPTRFLILQSVLIGINWITLEYIVEKTSISLIEGQAILIPFLALGSFLGSEFWVYPKNAGKNHGK